jgi:phage terminase small subunit
MAQLENARQEAFAQNVVKGMPIVEAYEQAGYLRNEGNAVRLKGNERVMARIRELQDEVKERTLVTVEALTSELEEARQLALDAANPSAAVSATMGKAKLNGLLVDRSEVTPVFNIAEELSNARARLRKAREEEGAG